MKTIRNTIMSFPERIHTGIDILKLHIFLICIILSVSASPTKAQEWEWAKGVTGNTYDYITDMVTSEGYLYVAGRYRSSSITFDGTSLSNQGGDDAFLIKYDVNGNLIWAQNIGGSGGESVKDIRIDASGNICLVGSFSDTISFGAITLSSQGGTDAFVVTFDRAGNAIQAMNYDQAGSYQSLDDAGNLYIAGTYNSSTYIFGSDTLTNLGYADAYLAKYDAGGNTLWARGIGGSHYESINGMSTDASGNVYITGDYQSSPFYLGPFTLNRTGHIDVFVAKYDANGNAAWAQTSVSTHTGDINSAYDIETDDFGNAYITGTHFGTISFGGHTLHRDDIHDVFTVKFASGGSVHWARTAGGYDFDYGLELDVDYQGNVYVTGYFYADVSIGGTTLNSSGETDIFIAKYNSAGQHLWAKHPTGIDREYSWGIHADDSGNVYVAGHYKSFTLTAGNTVLTRSGTKDLFLIKLGDGFPDPLPGDTTVIACPQDTSCTNELQQLTSSVSAYQVTLDITDGEGTYFSVEDSDADATNEIQSLSLSNDTLFLSPGGAFAKLPGDQVADADADPGNELQSLSLSNDTLFLSQSGYVKLPVNSADDADADSTNELQQLELNGGNLSISKGNSISLPDFSKWTKSGTAVYYNTGNVGIGTSAPLASLHIAAGNLLLDNSRYLTVMRSDDGFHHQIFGMDSNNDVTLNRSAIVHGRASRTIIGFGSRSFDVRNQYNQTLLRVTDDGKVGLSNSTPAYTLDVNGDGRINVQWVVSDGRYKKDISPLQNALEKIGALRSVRYEYHKERFPEKNFTDGTSYGFIAQELKKVLPDLVHTDPEGYHAVNYDALIPLLTEAVKEQQQLLDRSQEKLAQLPALRAELEALKALAASICNSNCTGMKKGNTSESPNSSAKPGTQKKY